MNISDIDYYPIRVFHAVAMEKSFSRAAEKLLRTQPAVSMMVRRLEDDLGERLIDRSGRDLILTDAGQDRARICGQVPKPAERTGELVGGVARQCCRQACDRGQ